MRVPTYATAMNLMNQTLRNKETFDLYNYQSITGLKSPNYSGYGMSAYNIVSLEATLGVTNNFMENNKILTTETKTINTSLDAIQKSINDFKSMLTQFGGMDLEDITPDYTGGELTFSDNADVYTGETITINGRQYTFAADNTGNNIDISGLTPGSPTYAEDVMSAMKNKIQATDPDTFAKMTFDGGKATFPLYTVNGTSSVLNANGVTTGTPHEMNQDQYLKVKELQNMAFTTMKTLADSLNTSANGKYLFGGGVSTQAPVNFPFKTLEEFQSYYDGINIKYPSNPSADLSNRKVDASDTGSLTFELDGANTNKGTITAANAGGFLKKTIDANANTTGDLIFNSDTNTIKATQNGAFNTLKAGDTMVIGGGDAGGNAKAYVIKSISADGKTITVDESTPVAADMTVTDGGDATFSTSFPVGSVISMNGFGNNLPSNVQVTGISPDGTELYVTVDPDYFPAHGAPVTVPASSKWSMSCESYYKGGSLDSQKMVSDNQSISFDINAADPAFEKMFRALGQMAQGNLVDTRNPADELDSLINSQGTVNDVEGAMNLIQSALFNGGKDSSNKNSDFYTVQAKVNSNLVVLNNIEANQKMVVANLENNIGSLKNVDKTEAAVNALLAFNNLEASYSVLQQAMSMSFLNYMK